MNERQSKMPPARENSAPLYRQGCRFTLSKMLFTVTIICVTIGLVGREWQHAKREQRAYQELRDLGAVGDDWPGLRDSLFGRKYAPIVALEIPPSVDLDVALPLVAHLDNLRGLTISSCSIDDSQLNQLVRLGSVMNLGLESSSITDAALPHLAEFTHLRSLRLQDTRISDDGFAQLESLLPGCRVAVHGVEEE